jgi:hypothetical protein
MKKNIGVIFTAAAILFCLSMNSFAGELVELGWKFPAGTKYTYDLNQSMTWSAGGKTGAQAGPGAKLGAQGYMVITCNGDDATLKYNLSPTVPGAEMTEEQRDMLSQSYQGPMGSDGRIKQDRFSPGGNMPLLFDLIFPLPPKSLNVMEPVKQDLVNFSTGGISNLNGEVVYTLNGVRDVGGISCADYHVSCKLKTAPDGKNTKNTGTTASLTGEYDCLFAINHGLFIEVDGTGTMEMNTASDSKDNPVQMNMVLTQTTSLKFESAEYGQPEEGAQ